MSPVELVNLALLELRRPQINSLAEASTEARTAAALLGQSRREFLSLSDWRFAAAFTHPALVVNDWPERWLFAYAVPSGMLPGGSLRAVPAQDPTNDPAPFPHEVLGAKIYSNTDVLRLRYTEDLANYDAYHPLAVRALALYLAARMSGPLAVSERVQSRIDDERTMALSYAVKGDAASAPSTYIYEPLTLTQSRN